MKLKDLNKNKKNSSLTEFPGCAYGIQMGLITISE